MSSEASVCTHVCQRLLTGQLDLVVGLLFSIALQPDLSIRGKDRGECRPHEATHFLLFLWELLPDCPEVVDVVDSPLVLANPEDISTPVMFVAG